MRDWRLIALVAMAHIPSTYCSLVYGKSSWRLGSWRRGDRRARDFGGNGLHAGRGHARVCREGLPASSITQADIGRLRERGRRRQMPTSLCAAFHNFVDRRRRGRGIRGCGYRARRRLPRSCPSDAPAGPARRCCTQRSPKSPRPWSVTKEAASGRGRRRLRLPPPGARCGRPARVGSSGLRGRGSPPGAARSSGCGWPGANGVDADVLRAYSTAAAR